MCMSVFSFKKFTLRNELSAMKVNTDGVLLGAWCGITAGDSRILDVGTGTGVIALMLAQRLSGIKGRLEDTDRIVGIDIDGLSVREADFNFRSSPWASCMSAVEVPLQEADMGMFDMIVSNPPYFTQKLVSPSERRAVARHCGTLSYADLLSYASGHLSPGGRLCMIIPSDDQSNMLSCAIDNGLFISRLALVRNSADKPFKRVMAEFTVNPSVFTKETITIRCGEGYSEEYKKITSDFYLRF